MASNCTTFLSKINFTNNPDRAINYFSPSPSVFSLKPIPISFKPINFELKGSTLDLGS